MQTFKVFIVDSVAENRVELKKILFNVEQVEKTIECPTVEDAVKKYDDEHPDVILFNTDSESLITQIAHIEELNIKTSGSAIIAYSAMALVDPVYALKSVDIGARFFVKHPFVPEEVHKTVLAAYGFAQKKQTFMNKAQGEEEARVLESKTYTVFSTKGGVGRTLFSVNMAIAIKKLTKQKVVLLDFNLQFGDVAIMMNLKPKKTIIDLTKELQQNAEDIDMETFMSYFIEHESGIHVLAAPIKPEESELVQAPHIEAIMKKCTEFFHYVVIDTPNFLSEVLLNALLPSDKILLLLTMELPTIKNGKLMLELMQKLNIPKEKLVVVMNRFNPKAQYSIEDISEMLEVEVAACVPSEGLTVIPSVENGEPFVMSKPDSPISKKFLELAQTISGYQPPEGSAEAEAAKPKKKGFFGF